MSLLPAIQTRRPHCTHADMVPTAPSYKAHMVWRLVSDPLGAIISMRSPALPPSRTKNPLLTKHLPPHTPLPPVCCWHTVAHQLRAVANQTHLLGLRQHELLRRSVPHQARLQAAALPRRSRPVGPLVPRAIAPHRLRKLCGSCRVGIAKPASRGGGDQVGRRRAGGVGTGGRG